MSKGLVEKKSGACAGDQGHLVVAGTTLGKVHEIFRKPAQVGIEGEDDLPVAFVPRSIASVATLYNSDPQRHWVVVGKTTSGLLREFWVKPVI